METFILIAAPGKRVSQGTVVRSRAVKSEYCDLHVHMLSQSAQSNQELQYRHCPSRSNTFFSLSELFRLEREWFSGLMFPLDVDVFRKRTTPPAPLGHDGPKSSDVECQVAVL